MWVSFQTTHWFVSYHHHLPVLVMPHPITKQRILFCLLVHRGIPIRNKVGILSYYPSWHAPSSSNSSFPLLSLTHGPPLLYGWVQVGGAWALYVYHFHVCPKLVYYSCICHGLEAHLCVLLRILNLLWRERVSEPSFFMTYFLHGLGLAWLWAFLSLTHSLFLP